MQIEEKKKKSSSSTPYSPQKYIYLSQIHLGEKDLRQSPSHLAAPLGQGHAVSGSQLYILGPTDMRVAAAHSLP